MSRMSLLVGVALLTLAALTIGAAASVAPAGPADPTGDLPGPAPPIVENASDTANYLFPDTGIERRSYERANVDVGSAVAASATRLDGKHRERTLEERLTSRPDDGSQRLAVAEAALADAQARMNRLDARHEALFRGYNNGTLSAAGFLRQLARLEAEVTAHTAYLDAIEADTLRYVDGAPSNFETRLSTTRTRTVTLPGPLADRISAALSGTADPAVFFAEGVDDALILGTVDDGRFYRQATVRDAYRPAEANTLTIEGALQRARELYTWVYSGGQGFQPEIGRSGPGLYRFSADHPQGSLVSYISSSTTDAFHEIHRLDAADIPVYRTARNGTDGLNLTVTTTTVTGPMRVETVTPAGIQRNATVLIDGEPVGTTGRDGTLWTVRPSGTFTLTVVGEDGATASLGRTQFLRVP